MEKETLEYLLSRLNIDVSIDVFKKEDIDLEFLKSLSEEELEKTLKEIKLSICNRTKILKELKSHTASWKENEIRIVLVGKTGSGKSATGNTILGIKHFKSSVSGSSVTSVCAQKSAVRFGQKVLIVDTPGIFDTKQSNTNIQQEIVKCISISSPGPHAFILVLAITRYTDEEQKAVQHFIDAFGENIFKYLIVLFTRKDDLDDEGKSLLDHIKSVPPSLQIFIEKCGGRVVAFNNRLKGEEKDFQVKVLLSMINANVEQNEGECYKNEMYIEAEKRLQEREAEIRKQAELEREKELQKMRKEISEEFLKEAEMHKARKMEELKKMKEEMEIRYRPPILYTTLIMEKETLESFLRRLNIDVSIEIFKKEDIDLDLLKLLSEEELKWTLKEIGVSVGNRMKILKALKSRTSSWKENEIRIVLIGKTGSGKSATGNTILGIKHFKSYVSGSSVTSVCAQKSAVRFGQKILIVDTPGVFDTTDSNKKVQQEIEKCINISSPGPHAFILVLNITRYALAEEKSVQRFVDVFGENVLKYVIILFTRKDDLDGEGITLYDYIRSAPAFLRVLVGKCGGRVIAFNNRLTGEEKDVQVAELLSMIYANVERNYGECYKNEMYIEAEKRLQEREAKIQKQAELERERYLQNIRGELSDELVEEAERRIYLKYKNRLRRIREIIREEEEKAKDESVINIISNFSKLILPGIFSKLK